MSEHSFTDAERQQIEWIRDGLLKLERNSGVRWPNGRAVKRVPELVPDEVGYDIRYVQALRMLHALLHVVGYSVYEYRNEYDRYIDSPAWDRLCWEIKEARGFRCERCGGSWKDNSMSERERLVVHHKTYERVGHELPEDLELLCTACHRQEHGIV